MDYNGIFGPDGALARSHPTFEYRAGQVQMAEAVERAIHDRQHLCVEAGTGTGKTLAYLFPAIASGKRTVISTATHALQEQLFFKDIPFLRQSLAPGLKAVCMKGRNNYLCLKKLENQLQNPTLIPDERSPFLQALEEWAPRTASGDRAELTLLREDDPTWRELDARRETCLGQKCSLYDECFITRLRQEALGVDLIVVNHSLFFADLALRRQGVTGIIPDYSVVIFDEAHEIEDIATSFFGRQVSSYRFEDFDRDLMAVFPRDRRLDRAAARMTDARTRLFSHFERGAAEGRQNIAQISRRPDVAPQIGAVEDGLRLLLSQIGQMASRTEEQEGIRNRAEELLSDVGFVCRAEDSAFVYWSDRKARGIILNASPIDLAPILHKELFSQSISVILTSATLSTDGSFQYIRQRLGVEDAQELVLGSEFDLNSQAVLYIPRIPEPRAPGYVEQACEEMRRILEISRGRAFLLFTSLLNMEKCYDRLAPELPFPVLKQGDLSKNLLLQRFRTTPSAVLFATASFWQGVDVQGDALSCVVIDKLPFAVPSDPIVAARLQHLEEQGKNAFEEYSIPQAIILLKQGLGRLIRSRQDRGILSILDSRILTRSYGKHFLRSLPKCARIDSITQLSNFFDAR